MPAHSRPTHRLRHRLPRSLRQHWKIAATLIGVGLTLATVFGAVTIRPYVTGDYAVTSTPITDDIDGTVDLFDAGVDHRIDVDIEPAEYQDVIETFEKEGEKDWATATVTIDGTVIDDVAVRLKGNSTLISLRGEVPDAAAADEARGGAADIVPSLSAEDPTGLPLLLSFDEHASGRAYQGMTELSIRPGSPGLNESVALELTAESGQPSQRYTYAVYSVNDAPTRTRLVLENPDEHYAARLGSGQGVLYKVHSGAEFAYRGDDQTAYAEEFTQINAVGTVDLQPVIRLLHWLDRADDATFTAEFGDWVDIESLARYSATQNLLANFDNLSGPGTNGYLYWDLETRKFSVISWDLNLALINDSTAGPHDTIDPPFGQDTAAAADRPAPRTGNPLQDRFLAADAFTGVYDSAYRQLYDTVWGSGRAVAVAEQVGARVPVSDRLSRNDIDAAVRVIAGRLDHRTESLRTAVAALGE